jgi:hypothetical protein
MNNIIISPKEKKQRLANWITPIAKAHLKGMAKKKNLSESVLLEIQIMKLK